MESRSAASLLVDVDNVVISAMVTGSEVKVVVFIVMVGIEVGGLEDGRLAFSMVIVVSEVGKGVVVVIKVVSNVVIGVVVVNIMVVGREEEPSISSMVVVVRVLGVVEMVVKGLVGVVS